MEHVNNEMSVLNFPLLFTGDKICAPDESGVIKLLKNKNKKV